MNRLVTAGIGIVALGGLVLATTAAAAPPPGRPPGITPTECKCQTATGKAQGKFAASKAKCIIKCQQNARKGKEPASDCTAPYAGPTATCVQTATTKAEQVETKGNCTKDCPECYSNGNCAADATSRTATTESQIDGVAPLVYCSPAPTDKAQQKCQDTQAAEASKFAAAKANCYAKCRDAECKGKATPGSCTPPATDSKTTACISKAMSKCSTNIDKKCTGHTPSCATFTTGAGLCGTVEGVVDSNDASTYCASPSGAFIMQ